MQFLMQRKNPFPLRVKKMNKTIKKIIIGIVLIGALYRLVTLLISNESLEYKSLLILGVLIFIFYVLTASSCYYFRRFLSRRDKKICNIEKDCSMCQPEGLWEKSHRFFYWPTFILIPIHLLLAFYLGFISFADPFFSSVALLFGTFYFLWLFSCRYFKYFFREKSLQFHPKSFMGKIFYRIYKNIKKIYSFHDTFFWLVFMFLVLHLITIVLRRI